MGGDEQVSQRGRQGFVHPRGRPLDYQGSQGWASRIVTRTLCAATIGAAGGLAIGIVRKQNPLQWFTSSGINCAIAACCFCASQETVRELRAADPDDWMNSFLGGFSSGALLGRLQGGPARALPVALVFASVGTGLHIGALKLSEYRLQHFLASLPHEELECDPKSSLKAISNFKNKVESEAQQSWDFPEWFPIRRLDEEAARKRASEKEVKRKALLENLHTGSLSVKDH